MKPLIAVTLALSLSSCGLLNPGSKGHFELAGDAHGVRSFMDGFTHDVSYWKQRHLDTTEETAREMSPGFISRLFGNTNSKGE